MSTITHGRKGIWKEGWGTWESRTRRERRERWREGERGVRSEGGRVKGKIGLTDGVKEGGRGGNKGGRERNLNTQ